MKDLREASSSGVSPLESDLGTYFDSLWREVAERDARQSSVAPSHGKVRLKCVGDLVDLESIGATLIRQPTRGREVVEFICPRCNELHESPRFA